MRVSATSWRCITSKLREGEMADVPCCNAASVDHRFPTPFLSVSAARPTAPCEFSYVALPPNVSHVVDPPGMEDCQFLEGWHEDVVALK